MALLLNSAVPARVSSLGVQAHRSLSGAKCIKRARRYALNVRAQGVSEKGLGAVETAVAVSGLLSAPVIAWSLYTLKTTGCGLPPGPAGLLGALEGVSYLVPIALVAWSITTKVRTGTGLPAGPAGLLGAAEGVSYLSLLAIAVVFGLQIADVGGLPPPVPSEQCFG